MPLKPFNEKMIFFSELLGFVWRQVICRQRLKSNMSLECTTQGDFYVTTPVYFSIIITFTVTLKCFKCNFNLSLKKVICFLRLLPVCQYFINCSSRRHVSNLVIGQVCQNRIRTSKVSDGKIPVFQIFFWRSEGELLSSAW